MSSNALKWQQKPETHGIKQATTVKMDRRIVRMAKIQSIFTSRKIKDDLKWPVGAVPVRRHFIEAKLSVRTIVEKMASAESVKILKGTHRLAQRKMVEYSVDWWE